MRNPIHRLSLRTLKFFLRFMRRTHALFTGTGVAIVSAALVIGIFMLIWWGIGAVRSAIELRLERALVERLLTLVSDKTNRTDMSDKSYLTDPLETPALRQFTRSSASDLSLVSASFSDLFSGTGWLDTGATTMHRDHNATAFLFEPQFELRPISPIGPIGQQSSMINDQFIGRVIKSGGVYKGLVSRADGTPIFTEANTPIVSKYPGELGFGGDENDFLAVYGAYEGMAYRVRVDPQSSALSASNLSHLFGIRMMGGGFRPAVLRVGSAWFVWDADGAHLRFLKLWEDGARGIIGITNLADRFIERVGGEVRKMEVLYPFVRFTFADGSARSYEFIDQGFNLSDQSVLLVQSSDLNEGRNAAVRRARISRVDLSYPTNWSNTSNIRFSLANREGEWLPVAVGNWLTFPDTGGKNLFWKAEFTVPSDLEQLDQLEIRSISSSPYFDLIQVEYFLKF